jgi:hypothetical protein
MEVLNRSFISRSKNKCVKIAIGIISDNPNALIDEKFSKKKIINNS